MADIRAFDIDVETKQTPRGVSLKRVERGDGKFLKALITMVADENGLLPGEVGYTEPVNKSLLVDAAGKSPGDVGYTGPIVQINDTTPVDVNQGDLDKDVDTVTAYKPTYDIVLQNAATENGDGTAFDVEEYKTLLISITGADVTTSTITFEGGDIDGNYTLINGVRLSDLTIASSTSTVAATPGEKWMIDIEGLTTFQAVLSALTGTGATVTVKGKAGG